MTTVQASTRRKLGRRDRWPAALAALAVGLASPSVGEPLTIGQQELHTAASPHPYGTGSPPGDLVWTHPITHPGAVGVWVHFAAFDLAPGDWVVVRNVTSTETEMFTNQGRQNLGTFWSRRIPGEDIVVELWGQGASPGFGVAIDRYAWAFTPVSTEGICGVNDLEDVICEALAEPEAYARTGAVARLTVFADDGSVRACTGANVSCDCDFLTNATCIQSASEAFNAEYEFGANSATCRAPPPPGCTGEGPPGTIFTGGILRARDSGLDTPFSLIDIDCLGDGASWLNLDRRMPQAGWRIYIPQHAGGCFNQFGMRDTDAPSGNCEILTTNSGDRCGTLRTDHIAYTCDTLLGSMGAPVLAHDSHRLIGFHDCAVRPVACEGTAIPLLSILPQLDLLLPTLPDDVTGLTVAKPRNLTDFDLALTWSAAASALDYRIYLGHLPQLALGTYSPGSYRHYVNEAAIPADGACSSLGLTSARFFLRGTVSPSLEDDIYYLVVGLNRCGAEGPFGEASVQGLWNPPTPIPPGLGCP